MKQDPKKKTASSKLKKAIISSNSKKRIADKSIKRKDPAKDKQFMKDHEGVLKYGGRAASRKMKLVRTASGKLTGVPRNKNK